MYTLMTLKTSTCSLLTITQLIITIATCILLTYMTKLATAKRNRDSHLQHARAGQSIASQDERRGVSTGVCEEDDRTL